MALPLKTGADLYNQQLIRARLQNLGAQPNTADVGLGQVYFNTGTNTAASLRIGYCYETGSVPKFHHVANLEDVNRLEELISALSGSSSESVASVLGRVITLEGYFSNGKAKDADLLDGHNSDYFAEAATLNDLLEDYEAFKAVFSDNSDEYINTWTEVKAFLDGIKNTEDLNAILLGINTELGKKADKATTLAGYGITDGIKYVNGIDLANGVPHNEAGYGYNQYGWKANGPALSIGIDGYLMLLQASVSDGQLYRRYIGGDYKGAWYKILDDNNYASVLNNDYLRLDGSSVMAKDALLKFQVGDDLYDWNVRRGQGFGIIDFNTKAETPQYRLGFHIGGSHYRLDISHQWGANILAYRIYDQTATEVGPWTSIIDANNYSNLITTLNGNLSVGGNISLQNTGQLRYDNKEVIQYVASNNSLYIGYGTAGSSEAWNTSVWGNNIKLINKSGTALLHAKESNDVTIGYLDAISVLSNQDVHIKGNLIVDGQVSSGGIGSEGSGSGASGIVILEDWEKYDDTVAQVVGAGLGVGLRDKIAALESKATNVSVAQTLTSGKEIGAITIDGVATKLFAPDDYLPLSGGTITGRLTTKSYVWFNQYDEDAEYGLGMTHAGGNLSWYNGSAWNDLLHAGNYESIVGDKFLKLSGGKIEGTSAALLKINRTNGNPYIAYYTNGTLLGYIGVYYNEQTTECIPSFMRANGNQYAFVHEGNFNHYGTTIASGTWNIDINGRAAGFTTGYVNNLDNASENKFFHSGFQASNRPATNYATGLTLRNLDLGWDFQLSFDSEARLYTRRRTTAWQDWKTVAFTDSNVASATKLQTARSLWGNSFDGTADINGDIHLAAGKGIVASNGYTVLTAPSYLLLGYAQSELGQTTYLDGNDIYLRYGKNHVPAMYINSSGNVTIGASDYAQQNCKLFVDGAINVGTYGALHRDANNHLWVNYGGSVAEKNLILCGYNTSFYYGKGSNYKSAMFINSSGNVGIGTAAPAYKLHIYDTNAISNPILVESTNTWGESSIAFKNKNEYLWSAGLSVGINNSDQFGFYSGTAGKTIFRITTSGAILDGTLKVSSRLLVGGATDDGTTALQVNGDIVIPNYTAYKAYDTYGGKMNLMYLDTSNRLKVYNDIMSFTPQGNVGIGTNNPACTLHIYGASTSSNPLCVESANTWGESSIAFKSKSGYLWTAGLSIGINNSDHFGFYSDTAKKVISRITPTGMVVDGDIRVTGNIIADGQVSSGGVAEAGTGGATGGSGLDRVPFTIPANTTSFTCEHNLGTREISVSIYEDGNDFQQVLADVYLDSTNVARIVFGSATDVVHKVVIIG